MRKKKKRSLIARLRRLEVRELHKHPFAIPAATFLILSFVLMGLVIHFNGKTVGANDAHVVIVTEKGKRQALPTRAGNVGDFLKRINIELHEGDVVEPTVDTPIVDDNFRVNVYRARPVTVIEGDHKTQSFSAATTPRSVAQQSGITLYPEDKITSQPTTSFLKDGSIGEQIVIERAVPINLNLYGTPVAIRTHAKTVNDLLKEKQIKLTEGETITPAVNTPITPNVQIFVTRFGTQIVTQEETVPMESEVIEDASLTLGTSAVRQAGSAGKKLVTYQLDLENGKEKSRRIIQEVVTLPPVKQITARGRAVDVPADKSAIMAAAGISSADYGYVSFIVSRESGWCPTKWQGQIGYCPSYFEDLHPIDSGFGYGLCQSTPAGKMATAGEDWRTNPVTQLRWCSSYAQRRYGSWGAAYNHWMNSHNW
jgi:resuscitation-promoting factor RpfB